MASTSALGSKRKAEDMDPFDGLAPRAPASASKLMKKPSYDVFINHHGADVKATLATGLYYILTSLQLSVFLDSKELESGDFFPRTLAAAMSSALVCIVIFSESYAKSPWCLAELSFIVNSGATIIPIFYYVDPCDLRWAEKGKGKYAKAFEDHEQKGRYLENLEEWKKALHAASFYCGHIVNSKEDEDRVLKTIVNFVVKNTKKGPLMVAEHPVGLDEIVEDFEKKITQGDQGVQVIGIWGMGGCGKTTLAKDLYNKKSSLFERYTFVFNVRDASSKGLLHKKQEEVLTDLGLTNTEFDNVEDGKETLLRHLRSVKVLIVLDDVDNVDQLDALLIVKNKVEKGSLIIVTSREYDVLESRGITCIYKMKALNLLYAKQLFCWHAFLQVSPEKGFEELVEKFVKACHGLPLSLKVIGAQLYGKKCEGYWKSLLHKITRILPINIQEILKISYDALDSEEKEMFLDIACFFIGEKYTLPIEIWNGLGQSGLHTWKRLQNKCLVECDDGSYVRMHDHIRDLGRDIASKQPPYRFWPKQPDIIIQNQQTRLGIRGIIATPIRVKLITCQTSDGAWRMPGAEIVRIAPEIDFRVCCSGEELMVNTSCSGILPLSPSSVGLKYLVISGDPFNQVIGKLSRELVWLRWFDIGQRKLPSGLSLKKLRVLELYEKRSVRDEHHLEELWGDSDGEVPVQLSELLICDCHKFQGFPKSIGHLRQLKRLQISYGNNITSLPDEFCFLESLERLELHFGKMQSLPDDFGKLSKLRYLSLCRCTELTRLPFSFKNLSVLKHLNFLGCSQLTFTTDVLEHITSLEFLDLSGCEQLEELPRHIGNNVCLKKLNFIHTRPRELPDNIGQLRRLEVLQIHDMLWTSLPTSLGDLSSLTSLSIKYCRHLECLPDSLGGLSSLTSLSIENCPHLECLPESLGGLSSLTSFIICGPNLECLPDSVGNLSSLTKLTIDYCPKLEHVPESLADLSSLTELTIQDCHKLEHVPESLGDLSSLTKHKIQYCHKLERHGVKSVLLKAISQLSNLEKLHLVSSPISGSSLSFGSSKLKDVKLEETEMCRISFSEGCSGSLDIQENHYLEEIEALPRTLESIHLRNCEMLKNLPSFAELTSLGKFKLSGCNEIEKIEGIENCTQLTELSADTCWEVPGIESLERLENLKKLKLHANKGIVIEHCIQTIQNSPDRIDIFAQAAPEAASLVDSLLPPNVVIVDSIANQKIKYRPKLVKGSSRNEAFMICLIINCRSSQIKVQPKPDMTSYTDVRLHIRCQGRWAWIGVFCPGDYYSAVLGTEELYICEEGECGEEDEVEKGFCEEGGCGEEDAEEDEVEKGFCEEGGCGEEDAEEDKVEKGFVLKGEKRALIEALRNLLPIYRS